MLGRAFCMEAWREKGARDVRPAVSAAAEGAMVTAEMTPQRGRASYLGDRALVFGWRAVVFPFG